MKKHLILGLTLSLGAFSAIAQQAIKEAPGKAGMYPAAIEFGAGLEPAFVRGTVLLKTEAAGSYARSAEVILRHSERDAIGQEHYRYQQTINKIPVEGAVYAVHVAGGKVQRQNGEWIATPPADLPVRPVISEGTALAAAMQAFGAKVYKWQLPEEEAFIKVESGNAAATFRPKAELVYYSDENEISADKLRLAFKLDLYAHEPVGRRIYFVDAETGAILGQRELLHHVNTTGTAATGYSGTRSIVSDSIAAGSYRLRETGRGLGIQTYNMGKGTNYSTATDFTDADNYWNNVNTNKDQYATDAHWGAEMTYDYFKNNFNRNSIDNAGFAIKSYVHYSNNYYNAFWDGSRMTYGDGSSANSFKPLTALDVCGHEIAHGLTSFTANLNYSYESGALNEGFSDIFGTAIEFFAKPTSGNWTMGEAFGAIRSMSNPNAYSQPDTYQGSYWATGSADYGGVHTNSGVLNFWFYLLTQGGTGTNDKSYAYSVSGIGITKAGAIAYRTLTYYLTPTSNYAAARTYSIQAATDLYGATSNEVTQVTNAWNAVGVGNSTQTTTCSDTYESNETRTASKSIAVNTDIIARIGSSTDKDWFSFSTTSSAPKLKVSLSNLPADYDVRLYNASGTQIGISQNSSTTAENISYNSSSSAATYYVQVYGYNGANSTTCYKLRVATGSVNQLVEHNNNNTLAAGKEGADADMMAEALSVFPNPAKDKLQIRFGAAENGMQALRITDLMGRVVSQQSIAVQQGANQISIPLDGFASGFYFLHLSGMQAVKFQIAP